MRLHRCEHRQGRHDVAMTLQQPTSMINSIICNDEARSHASFTTSSAHFAQYWRGFATFGPVPILSKGAFEAINIVVPPTKNEETEIAEYLRALDAKAEVHMRRKAPLTPSSAPCCTS